MNTRIDLSVPAEEIAVTATKDKNGAERVHVEFIHNHGRYAIVESMTRDQARTFAWEIFGLVSTDESWPATNTEQQ